MNWIVITIKPNQSKKAEKNLISQGFNVFFPRIYLEKDNKVFTQDLFSGYAFVKLNDTEMLKSINATRGVSKVLRLDNKIPKVAKDIIERIKMQIKDIQTLQKSKRELKISDKVLIKLNIFKNQAAEIINILDKRDSQKVLLRLLNSPSTMWVSPSDISALD